MTDRDEVVAHLMIIKTWAHVNPKYNMGIGIEDCSSVEEWINDALELLRKENKRHFLAKANGEIVPLDNKDISHGNDHLETKNDYVEIVRCKDCKHRGKAEKCVLAAISAEKDYPVFMLDNRGEWFCADGERKEE